MVACSQGFSALSFATYCSAFFMRPSSNSLRDIVAYLHIIVYYISDFYFRKLSIGISYKSANLNRTSVGTTNMPSSYLQIVLLLRSTILPRAVRLRCFCLRRRRRRLILIRFIKLPLFHFLSFYYIYYSYASISTWCPTCNYAHLRNNKYKI